MRDNTPAEILRAFLVGGAVLGDHTETEWPSVYGFFPDDKENFPSNAVCFYDMDGVKEVKLMRNNVVIERPVVAIHVRGVNYKAAYAKAKAIKDVIDGYRQVYIKLDDYYYSIVNAKRTSTIIPMGQTMGTTRRFLFAINYELLIGDPTEDALIIDSFAELHTIIHITLPNAQ